MSVKLMERKIIKWSGEKGNVYIIKEYCKGCGICIEFCPTKVLVFSEEFNSKGYHPPEAPFMEKCSGCDLCGMYCPEFAIWGEKVEKGKGDKG